jgi:hypothetical protein
LFFSPDNEGQLQSILDSGSRIRIPNVTTFSTEPMSDINTDGDAVVERQRHILAMAKVDLLVIPFPW